MFFDNFGHNFRRLIFYWTLHGSCLFKVHRCFMTMFIDVDAENVLLGKLSSSRKLTLHVVYIFELAWNSLTLFWHSDQRLSRNSPSLLYCMFGVLACLMCFHTYMRRVLACLRVRVFSMLACLMSLRAHIFYMLAVLKYLTCLRAWYPRLIDVWQGSKCAFKGPFKKFLIKQGDEKFTKKVIKNYTGGECTDKKFLQPFFLVTQFLLLRISLIGSNNITVSNNNKHLKGHLFLLDNYTITSKTS